MAPTRITLRQLEALLAMAEQRSFALAGERIVVTSSAVSQILGELEALIGLRLFDRTTRRVALTSAGQDFLASAETVLRHVRAAEATAGDLRNRAAGIVRVAAPLVLAATALPAAIKAYSLTCPKVVVRVLDRSVEALVERVAGRDVDLALWPNRPTGGTVDSTVAFESPWVTWRHPSFPFASHPSVTWAELRDAPLVAADRDHELSVERMRSNVPPETRIVPVDVVDNITTALGLSSQRLAATLAPQYVGLLAKSFGLAMRRGVELETIRQICVYHPIARASSPASEGFMAFLTNWLPDWHSNEASSEFGHKEGAGR